MRTQISNRRRLRLWFAVLAGLFLTGGIGCASHTRSRRTQPTPVERAEQLMRAGQIDSARQQLTMLRDSLAGTVEGGEAQYALAHLNVFSANPSPDWSAALMEFRRYMTEYPQHAHVDEAYAWVRLLSEFETLRTADRMRADRVTELLQSDMLLKQMGGSEGVNVILESMRRCMVEKDSLAAKIRLMEEVIRAIEKGR